MAEETIGKAYIQVLPSIKDFKPQLEKEIQTDLSSAGTDAGNSFGDSLKSALKAAGIAYAAKEVVEGVAQVVQQAIGNYAEFETATAKVATIMDTSVMSIEEMQTGIMDLSNQFGISTSELSDTVYNAISATGDTANALEIAESAAKLASAGFTDTGSALSVLTTAMNAYGLSADEASAISDSLIQVQNLGVTTVAELSTVMGKAIASASAYGVDLGNVEAAYVSMTKAGISTAESTTYMSSMMKELGDSGSNVSAILKNQTGKSFSELMGDGYSLADVLGILYESCGEDSTALMNLWSSAEAGKASNAIISQGLEEFNNNLEAITTSAGTTQTAFETMDDTLESKISKLSTAWTNLLTGMASGQDVTGLTENLITQFESVADAVVPLVENIADALPQVFTTIGEKLPELLGALLPSLIESCASLLTSLISNLPTVIEPLISALPSVIDSLLDGLIECLPQLLAGMGNLIGQLVAELPDMLSSVVTAIPDILLGIGEGLASGIANTITAVFGSEEYQASMAALNADIDNLLSSTDLLNTQLATTKTNYENATTGAEANAVAAETLLTKINSLIAGEEIDAGQKEIVKGLVNELNELVPGLSLKYDEQTNSLSLTNAEILNHINNMKLEAEQAAAMDFYTEALKNQYQAELDVKEASKVAAEFLSAYGVTAADMGLVTQALGGDLGAAAELAGKCGLSIADMANIISQGPEVIEGLTSALANQKEAEEQVAWADELVTEKTQDLIDAQTAEATAVSETADSVSEDMQNVASEAAATQEAVTTATEEMAASVEESSTEIVGNMDEVQTAYDEFDGSGAVTEAQTTSEMIVDASDISDETGANTIEAMDAMVTSIDEKMSSLSTAFSAIVLKASEKLGAQSQFQANLKVYGQKIPTLMSNGATEQQSTLMNTMSSIVNGVADIANQLQGIMQNAGNMAGQGLYNGLGSWAGALYNQAWSIANSINAAARAALQIRSPSHVMEEVGKFTGEGLAVGIEDSKEDVNDAMTDLTDSMVSTVSGVVDVANRSAASVLGSPVDVQGMVNQSVSGTVLAEISQSENNNVMDIMINIYNALVQLANMQMVLDTGEVVAALAPEFDKAMAAIAGMEARR